MPELTDLQKSITNIDYLFKRTKVKNDQPERIIHRNICDHLQTYYPDVYFMSDPSGIKLSANILKLLKSTRSRHSQLDIIIINNFSNLILEVKSETPYKLNGELKTDSHLKEQFEVMKMLRAKGHICEFVWNLGMAIKLFELHLGKPVISNEPLFP